MEILKVNISHPDKIVYPEIGITKGEVVTYYNFIAPYMLPYIKNRALSLQQFPAGVTKPGFFHKHTAAFYPSYIKRLKIPTTHHGIIEMSGVNSSRGLVFLANQNTIEFHMALAMANKHNNPDQIILDFDPSDDDFKKVRKVALITKEILDEHKLANYVKTTGAHGLHVHIPLKSTREFKIIKQMALDLAEYVVQQCPDIATLEFRKNKRGNKVFVDYLRNDHSATAIAPYSLRANSIAGVATPIQWQEVKNNRRLNPQSYHIKNIKQKLKRDPEPWLGI